MTKPTEPTRTYTPESELRKPVKLVAELGRSLLASRELAWRLAVRDIRTRYRQSILGVAWAIVPPIATGLLFVLLTRNNIVNVGETDIPYPAYAMIGTVLWQLFVDSINSPLTATLNSKSILTKANFPRESLIISGLVVVLFDMAIRLGILIVVFAVFQIAPTWGMLMAPFGIIMIVLLGVTLGVLLVPIGLLYTDITLAMTTGTSLWFFLTPVIYPPPLQGTKFAFMLNFNPVSPLIVNTREWLTQGTISNPYAFVSVAVITLLAALFAWVLYRVAMPIVAERLGA